MMICLDLWVTKKKYESNWPEDLTLISWFSDIKIQKLIHFPVFSCDAGETETSRNLLYLKEMHK